ncbi:MAG TPA: hypothetical protein VGW38_03790 [Chloroflexota bacterium]|nr:hypothetical protein [Chloroflexota bacterium]
MTDDTLQARLDHLHKLAEHPEAASPQQAARAVYREARVIIDELQAELESYRGGMGPEDGEAETALADALHALQACVRYIEAQGGGPECLREARAILEDSRAGPV